MGLPLFVAPVESDVPCKPLGKSPTNPDHARSSIRRGDRRRQLREMREHQLRMLAALQGTDSSLTSLADSSESTGRRSTDNPVSSDVSPLPRISSRSPFDASEESLWSRLVNHRDSMRSNVPTDGHDSDAATQEISYLRDGPESRSVGRTEMQRHIGWVPTPQETSSLDDLMQRPRHRNMPRIQARVRAPPTYRRSDNEAPALDRIQRLRTVTSGRPRHSEDFERRVRAVDAVIERGLRRSGRLSNGPSWGMDGLGDRDRSLSPEGDGVWDTLQSTLTPDPQPPSVGSSFASTSASTTASQVNASSSNTSVTSPIDETEPPCEDNADSDEDEENVDEQHLQSQRRPLLRERRSYADVAAEAFPRRDEDSHERLEWLSDMQRIVQRLAAREDIPSEWWAAAGLSRSMTFDDSN